MQIRNAIKVIVILLIILIVLLVAILLISSIAEKDDNPSDGTSTEEVTTDPAETTSPNGETESSKLPESTTPEDTTTPETTTGPESTTPPENTTEPSDTTKPGETTSPDDPDDPPSVIAPAGFKMKKTFKTDNGTALKLRAVINAVEENGRVRVTAELYLDYYSLYLGKRNDCRLTLNGRIAEFDLAPINESSNTKHSMQLAKLDLLCEYGETVNLSAYIPFRGSYAGIEIEDLTISENIEIKK